MKFFLLLGLFFVVVWLIRGGRRRGLPDAPPQAPVAPPGGDQVASESIIACVHCGVHLPQSEAVSGAAGWFCGEAHRLAHDVAQPR